MRRHDRTRGKICLGLVADVGSLRGRSGGASVAKVLLSRRLYQWRQVRVLGCVYVRLTLIDDCFIPTNYKKIMARVSAAPLAQAHIQLDTVMTSVEARTNGALPVCVTMSDGNEQYFDDVVVTTPLGWLKQHRESIPQLHPRIKSAIDSISFGRLEKVFGSGLPTLHDVLISFPRY
jgi:hypothetical protein